MTALVRPRSPSRVIAPFLAANAIRLQAQVGNTAVSRLVASQAAAVQRGKKEEAAFAALDLQRPTYLASGWRKRQNVVRRPRRSYAGQRDFQVLREVATQLFLKIKSMVTEEQEIECMFAGGSLFVAGNSEASVDQILTLSGSLEDVLTKCQMKTKTSKSGRISARHGRKLKKHYQRTRTSPAAGPIFEVVRAASLRKLTTSSGSVVEAFGRSGQIYVVSSTKDQHAEEKLMDVLALAGNGYPAVIAGKKRPCGTCLGRMQHMSDQGFPVTFGGNPGLLWKERFTRQPADVRAVTARELAARDQYVSEIGQGYGSESDSEDEDEDDGDGDGDEVD